MRFNKDDFKNVCPNGNEGLDWEQIRCYLWPVPAQVGQYEIHEDLGVI